MRKIQQAAVVVAAVSGLFTLGAGVSFAEVPAGYNGAMHPGPQASAWATSQSAAGATATGGSEKRAEPRAAEPQVVPQAPAPQVVPQAPAPQVVPQAPAPQVVPQAPAPQVVPQAPAPAPQVVPQAPARQAQGGHHWGGHHRDFDIKQSTQCKSHDLNVNILGQVGLLNGVLGNALNGEGHPGAQSGKQGSRMGCNNDAFRK